MKNGFDYIKLRERRDKGLLTEGNRIGLDSVSPLSRQRMSRPDAEAPFESDGSLSNPTNWIQTQCERN